MKSENDENVEFWKGVVFGDMSANNVEKVQPKPTECEDCISREAVLRLFATHDGKHLYEAISDLPPVHPESIECEDAISRQVLKASLVFDNKTSDMQVADMRKILEIIDASPSVQPKQRTGQWKPYDRSWYECSECGAIREAVGYFENFCPHCGAKMEVEG